MNSEQPSPSEQIIPPEIVDDAFYEALRWLAACEPIRHILEIGSSAGAGSTKALVEGIRLNPSRPTLYCLEVSGPRFALLAEAYSTEPSVRVFNASSVPADEYPTEAEIVAFYKSRQTALNQFPIEMVLGWREEGLRYLRESGVEQSGIRKIKKAAGIAQFDMALIDGAEFTGKAELRELYGAKIICMDDILTFKCFENREALLADDEYELALEDATLRNGFSVFIRKDFESRWLHVKRATEQMMRASKSAAPKSWRSRFFKRA